MLDSHIWYEALLMFGLIAFSFASGVGLGFFIGIRYFEDHHKTAPVPNVVKTANHETYDNNPHNLSK